MTAQEIFKRRMLMDYAQRFHPRFFVETGTYKGDTVKAMLVPGLFEQIHTIDIYEDRVQRAKRRFASFDTVHCWQGDSAEMLPEMIRGLNGPILFWLDAHHSGKQIARTRGLIETPIVAELKTIFAHPDVQDHIILVDDARYFDTFGNEYDNYPTTAEIRALVAEHEPEWTFEIKDDVLRMHA